MAEPKKPEADNTDPEKATATGKTRRGTRSRAKAAEKPADTAAETVKETEPKKEKITKTVSHKEEKIMTQKDK